MGMGTVIDKNDCSDAVVRSMAAYIRQLEGEIDFQQRENKRLSDKITELQKSLKSFNDDALSRIFNHGELKACGDGLGRIFNCGQLDSDKDPFTGGPLNE